MSKNRIKHGLIVITSCLIMLFFLSSCKKDPLWDRIYFDDIRIPLETHNAEIILREYMVFRGSGVEVYYTYDGEEIFLGYLRGADENFYPIKEGLYSVTEDGNELIIEWPMRPQTERDSWYKDVFVLPDIPTAQENTDDASFPWLTVGICGGVCVIGGVAAFLIVRKRKKHSVT